MSNVLKFDNKRKPEQPPDKAKTSPWTIERLAWPGFIALGLVVYLVRSAGLFG